ncbi:ATP-binding cassette subfamily F protein uup [Plasticicumulans lactativorans]|uniref:ATP-binding protein Uup n=1 Tax=Plasticicumulans lactativorans TaxID=1133106 RepID=A0A4R2LCE2_9GAMM|nr:ATP-binding cassette domain-containing protein [Plasticicumulans lactativorans]TCO82022.1 ATP-binding cassette subfamily F protein uup [Plasticicumulans lactativorans]
MPLLSFTDVSIAFGLASLLDHASFQIDAGERVCLIGRNGTGKSTLLKLVDGTQAPDGGEIWRQPGLKIARLEQEMPEAGDCTVFEMVADGLPEIGRLLADYHAVAHAVAHDHSDALLKRMEHLQHELEARDGWSLNQRVEQILSRLSLPADATLGELSGGWRRRVLLGRALVGDPDLLLLDEPTNHLDVEAIQWLEEQLLDFRGGVLFVTHDRALLERLATRILELDRGKLTSWPGDYPNFLEKKAAALEEEARHNALFDKKLAQEEAWIRQGIKARRTRNEGRVRALKALREERRARREVQGRASFSVEEAAASGKLVAEVTDIGYAWEGRPIVRDFSARIMRGDRIGLIGPNGAGKTTLLRLLLGQLTPDRGSVRLGTKLEVAYFDQLRARLDPELSVIDNIAEGREFIEIGGERKHIISYLQDFLFSPERTRTPVRSLSGGERNRLLLARLFSQPANLLVLDEPTNDLDIETLELLEERLMDFGGTLLLVSHDRAFLDNVVTSSFVFEGDGRVREYVGGYSDWLRQRGAPVAPAAKPRVEARPPVPVAAEPAKPKPGKLSYKDARELDALPARIEALEAEQAALSARTADAGFYRQPKAEQNAVLERLNALGDELAAAYARWDQLEALKDGRA